MIIGIGIDVVDIARFERALVRVPRLRERLFTTVEGELSIESLAARFAAKEALVKALGSPGGMRWTDAEVVRPPATQPRFRVVGTVKDACVQAGVAKIHLSMSHDGGIAMAYVVAEGILTTGATDHIHGSLGAVGDVLGRNP